MPEKRIGQCIATVQDYGYGRLHVEIPIDMLHKFEPGMEVEVIEVRKKTVIAFDKPNESKQPRACTEDKGMRKANTQML